MLFQEKTEDKLGAHRGVKQSRRIILRTDGGSKGRLVSPPGDGSYSESGEVKIVKVIQRGRCKIKSLLIKKKPA